jgi:hypothetical protein
MGVENKTQLFLMQQPTTFKWPVKVPIPLNGKYVYAEFTGEFPNLSQDAVDKLTPVDAAGTPARSDRQLAEDVLIGFEGVTQPDGTELPFTPENKQALMANPRVAEAVARTFLAANRGLAAEKN